MYSRKATAGALADAVGTHKTGKGNFVCPSCAVDCGKASAPIAAQILGAHWGTAVPTFGGGITWELDAVTQLSPPGPPTLEIGIN